ASRLSGAGHQIGLSEQAVLGFSAALANVGLNAELGGTALSKVMSAISVSVDTGGKKLEAFASTAGMAADEFAKLFKSDAEQALKRYIEGLGKAGDKGENLTIILQEMGLKGANVQDVMKRLAGAGDQVSHALDVSNQAWRDNTALTVEAEKRFATTSSQLKILWNNITDVGITIGNALLPAIQTLVRWSGDLIPIIEGAVKLFTSLPAPIQLAALGLTGLVAAAGPALYIFGQLSLSAAAVTAAFTTNGIATVGLTAAMNGLKASLAFLGPAIAVAGTAFVSWKIGAWVGDITGATAAVQHLTEKVMGYRDASEPLESQQKLINQAIKLGADASIDYAGAMKFLQAKAEDLRAASNDTAKAVENQGHKSKQAAKDTKEESDAHKEAAREAKAHAKAVSDLADTYTGKKLADQVQTLNEAVRMAERQGGLTAYQYQELVKQLIKLHDQGAA